MALGALDAGAEEDADGVRHVVEGHAAIAHVVADGAVIPGFALSCDEVADELVVGRVGAEAFFDEVGVGGTGDGSGLVAIGGDAEDVGPVVEGMLDVGLGSEEFVDQSGSFVGVFRREEGFGFAGGGDAADEVEVDAADEGVIVSGGVALEFVFFPVGTQDGVDGSGFSRDIRWGSDEAELG